MANTTAGSTKPTAVTDFCEDQIRRGGQHVAEEQLPESPMKIAPG